MAINNDLGFDLGEDWVVALTCHQADGVTLLDLTGATVTWAISGILGFSPTIAVSGAPASGVVNLRATPAQQTAAGILAGSYTYTMRAVLADGTKTDQSAGLLTIRQTEF